MPSSTLRFIEKAAKRYWIREAVFELRGLREGVHELLAGVDHLDPSPCVVIGA
jgi:hypothetical protein